MSKQLMRESTAVRTVFSAIRRAYRFVVIAGCVALSACESLPELASVLEQSSASGGLSQQVIADGLREALEVGSTRVVSNLGARDGFLQSVFRVPLPEELIQAKTVAARFGLEGLFTDLEVKLNRAAEAATPEAQKLFVSAIRQMTFGDVMSIYNGPQDAATQYLRRSTERRLNLQMRPIVDQALSEVGGLLAFQRLAERYNQLPLVQPIDTDVSRHVLMYASRGLFAELASEEAAIRNDPAKRSTELLRRVFGY